MQARVTQKYFRDLSANGENYGRFFTQNEKFWHKLEGQKVKDQGEL